MSMNLFFYSKIHNLNIDFPFQTPTNLSYQVIKLSTKKERIKILEDWINTNFTDDYQQQYYKQQINKLMNDENLELFVS